MAICVLEELSRTASSVQIVAETSAKPYHLSVAQSQRAIVSLIQINSILNKGAEAGGKRAVRAMELVRKRIMPTSKTSHLAHARYAIRPKLPFILKVRV